MNPLAVSLTSSDRKIAGTLGISYAATLGAMYLLHRKGHHRAERVLGWIVASGEASAAGINTFAGTR